MFYSGGSMKRIALVLVVLMLICGCTDNVRSRKFGGTTTENLEPGKKLINITWKNSDLWILTKPMRPGDLPETYEFTESSSIGLLQGKIIIKESK
jgi:hypothetical protein